MRRNLRLLVVVLVANLALAGCFGRKKSKGPDIGASAEPDKVLYERARDDIRHGRHDVGRLTLQTLINTYPDSEYLAKAKLAIADSFYKEGGTAGLTQAVAEYKDFITFFPFLEEAAYAQMQVGMAHYRRMEKPDRDRTEGRLAEEDFQTFLKKFPQHALAPQATQRLREVQEVLAEGDFRIANYYNVKGSYRAAGARLIELTSRYPLYSQGDRALWMLGSIFERNEKGEIAAQYYSRIVREYPLSNLVDEAKARLTKLGVPVPQPNAEALARQQREREADRQRPGLLRRSLGMFKTGPDVSRAALSGDPNLAPASETVAGTETLTPGGKQTIGGASGTGRNTALVETVTPGSPGSSLSTGSTPEAQPPAAGTENPPNTDPSSPEVKPGEARSETDVSKPPEKEKKGDDKNKKKESSSKKKKGLRKVIPW